MDQLSPSARAAIEAHRRRVGPTAEDDASVWNGVERRLASGERVILPERRVRGVLIAGMGVALAAAAAVVLWVAIATPQVASRDHVSGSEGYGAQSVQNAGGTGAQWTAPPAPTPRRTDAEPVLEPALEPRPEATLDPARGKTRPKPRPTRLSAEAELIRRARAALARGDGAIALRYLRRHRRDFPKGALEPEREVLWITTLCDKGDVTAAKKRAVRFRKRHPGSALNARVAAGCRPR